MKRVIITVLGLWIGMLFAASPSATTAPKQLYLVTDNSADVDITKAYFVGGVKDVPGDVVKKFYEQCGGAQKTEPCSKWYQWFCDPRLICNDKNFWSKKKGWNVGK